MMWKTLFAILLICGAVAKADDSLVIKSGTVLLRYGVVELESADGEKKEFKMESDSGEISRIVMLPGESLRVREKTNCNVVFPDAGVVRVEPETGIKLPAEGDKDGKGAGTSLELLGGKLFLDIDGTKLEEKKKQFRLKTPTAILAVRGTRFFVEAVDGVDTAGVHEGQIIMSEPVSGNKLVINTGIAAVSTWGAIPRPRKLTIKEKSFDGIYKGFAIKFSPAERNNRKYEPSLKMGHDTDPALLEEHAGRVKVEKSTGLDIGQALKITAQTLPKALSATVTLELPVRLRSEPVGLLFYARSPNLKKFLVESSLSDKDRSFHVWPHATMVFPENAQPNEWMPFFVPFKVYRDIPKPEEAHVSISFKANPLNSKKQEAKDKLEYALEISPVMVGVRPDE